jgi:3-oxoacyl-[acyl-carrier protein] reductase
MNVLVLGGSGALGGAVGRLLAAEGARVAFTYFRNEAAAIALKETLPGGVALKMDARRAVEVDETVAAAAKELGGLDALVHCVATGVRVECAGAASNHRMPQQVEADWDELVAVNAKSAWLAVRAAVPHLRATKGNVVLVGSVDSIKPLPAPVHYAASKAALVGMAQAMAKELGPDQVKVNLVAPGVLEAGIIRNVPKNLRDEYDKHCGLKRPGKLDEVAHLITWLCTQNTYVTAQKILLDGAL